MYRVLLSPVKTHCSVLYTRSCSDASTRAHDTPDTHYYDPFMLKLVCMPSEVADSSSHRVRIQAAVPLPEAVDDSAAACSLRSVPAIFSHFVTDDSTFFPSGPIHSPNAPPPNPALSAAR